jgi:hypothetical protein
VSVKIPQKLKYLIWALTICIWIAELLATTKSLNSDAVAYQPAAQQYVFSGKCEERKIMSDDCKKNRQAPQSV